RARRDILYRTTPQSDPGFLEWARKHRPDLHRGVWGTVTSRDREPYPRSVFEEYRQHTMSDEEKAIVGAMDAYLGRPGPPTGSTPPDFPSFDTWRDGRRPASSGGFGLGVPNPFFNWGEEGRLQEQ